MDNGIVLAMIGCGTIGKFHVKNIRQNFFNVKIKYICDVDIENVKKWAIAENFAGDTIFTPNYEEILKDKEVNAVAVATQITQHAEVLLKAVEAGKNVFCEKQIGVDPVQIKKAIDVAGKNKIKLQVGFHRRFDLNYIKAREMIARGDIGDIHMARATTRLPEVLPARYLKKGLFAGHFNEVTSHDFDILRYITQLEVNELYAAGTVLIEPKFAEIGDYDTIMVTLQFDNGSIGSVDGSMQATYGFDQRVEVFGSKGCIFVNNKIPTQLLLYNDNGGTVDKLVDKAWSSQESYGLFYMDRYHKAFIKEFEEFFKAIIYDTEPICTGMDGLKNILICNAAKESADKNIPIKIDYGICN